MILTAITMIAMLSAEPKVVAAPIVAASMFKNGYAVTIREFSVPGPGEYKLPEIPKASYGTLWFSTAGGVKLSKLETASETREVKAKRSSFSSILEGNIGIQLRLGLKNGDDVSGTSVTGKLVSAENEVVILETEKGTLVIPKSAITSISGDGQSLNIEETQKVEDRVLKFQTEGGSGKIWFIELESGLSWSPAYLVDVSDKKKLKLTAKSVVINDLSDLNSVSAKFITGVPNMPYATTMDPMSMAQIAVQGFSNTFTNNSQSYAMGTHIQGVTAKSGNLGFDQRESFNVSPPQNGSQIPGAQVEDLFFYDQPGLSLKKGEKSYIEMFQMEAPYEDLYTWDLMDSTQNNTEYRQMPEGSGDVWHELTFKNTSGHPFTTAVATTIKDGQLIGQDTMSYVSANQNAEVKVTKAMDIHAEAAEEETGRDRQILRSQYYGYSYDLVTLKGTLTVTNFKSESVKMRIRKDFTGEFVSAGENPKVDKTAKGLLQANPVGKLTWTLSLKPGEQRTVTYTYKLYVRSA